MSDKESNATEAHCSLISKTVITKKRIAYNDSLLCYNFLNNVISLFNVFSHSPELSSKGNNVYMRISEEINLTEWR